MFLLSAFLHEWTLVTRLDSFTSLYFQHLASTTVTIVGSNKISTQGNVAKILTGASHIKFSVTSLLYTLFLRLDMGLVTF